jgi:hypothetical protein
MTFICEIFKTEDSLGRIGFTAYWNRRKRAQVFHCRKDQFELWPKIEGHRIIWKTAIAKAERVNG